MRKLIIFAAIFIGVSAARAAENSPVLQDIDYTAVIEQKMKLENKLEKYVNGVLDKWLGPDKALVRIDITPNASKSRVETESWAQKQSDSDGVEAQSSAMSEFLPGIPRKQDIMQKAKKEGGPGEASGQKRSIESVVKIPEAFIKKIDATLIVDQALKDEEFTAVKTTVVDMLGIDLKRGDKLNVMKVKFSPFKKLLSYLTNLDFYLALVAIALCLLFLRFLFSIGPTLKDLKQLKSEVDTTGDVAGGGGGGGGAGGGGSAGVSGEQEGEAEEKEAGAVEDEIPEEIKQKELKELVASLPVPGEEVGKMAFKPFKFVEESDLKKIAYLLSNEEPEVTATVIHYLDDAKAAKLLKLFPEHKKPDVIMAITKVQFVEQKKIACLERVLKRRIDLTSGGVDRLLDILSLMDDSTKKEVMGHLSSENPEIAEKVEAMMFSFEKMISFDDHTLQTVLAEINAPELAIAMKGTGDDFKAKIMTNLSEAAGKLVEEEQEAGRAATATDAQVTLQRRAIITKLKELDDEGKINLGGTKEISVFEDELTAVSSKNIMEEVEEEMEKEKKREAEREERRKKIGMTEDVVPVLDNEKSFEHYSRGEEFFQEGNYEDAILEFEASIQYNPEIWQTYQFMGSALFALGREQAAVTAYEKCLELNPGNEELTKWMKEYHHKNKQSAEAAAEENQQKETSETGEPDSVASSQETE
ncbi:MAG: FliG C-terminal domain-containing protein [Elusimicrobiota bacterium]|nr:FliG C-terminal domain-containing protein [Elusimicrobiota bacterium]